MIDTPSLAPALAAVKAAFPAAAPRIGLVLGSGWSDVASAFDKLGELSYADIPGYGAATVVGHAGKLVWCRAAGVETFLFMGRRHYYEGIGWNPVALPAFLLKSLGAKAMFLTNAAGGVNADWAPGDLMLIEDHINMMGVTPLLGAHDPFWGPRFPDQSHVYDRDLQRLLRKAAQAAAIPLRAGIYLAGTGPTYETPAEIRAWRALGADAVGMSTVPEAMLGNAAGLRILGLSCITNMASGILDQPLTHEEVTETTRRSMANMRALIAQFWNELGAANTL
ncbi:MAG: purine-nucleoside phosphorylase [Kiritimatiellae bacterium]|nr:purine-nucleoside phosphorylase [Kiritimatiellia bacterium]MBR0055878.1 purine-nucleoside phosphorylase [Kiritimatiellia bacterium]